MQRTKSNSLHSEALHHLVGGVNSPVRAFKSVHGNLSCEKEHDGR